MRKLSLLFMAFFAFTALIAQEVPTNWTLNGGAITITEETVTVNEGTKAASLTWTSTSNQDLDSDPIPVTEGATFFASVDVLDNDAQGRVRIGIFWGATADPVSNYNPLFTEDNIDWQTNSFTGTVPPGATEAVIKIRCYDVAPFTTATVIVDNIVYTENGGSNLLPNGGLETWGAPVLNPALSVTAPTNNATVAVDNVDIVFSTENFELGTDGSLEYILNGGTAEYATASPVNVAGLTVGANTIVMQLVDMSNAALDPVVTVTRTVNYEIPSTDPALTITFPADASTIYAADVNIAFTVENFDLGTDGKIAYSVDGGATAYHTTTDAIELTGLSYAEHTVDFELVDMSDASLDPVVETSVTFTCAEALPGGMETFENSEIAAGTSYSDGSFVGDEGFTWNYYQCRDTGAFPINNKGIMLRRASVSYIESGTISGGIASFQLSMRKAFTSTNERQLELYINGELKGTSEIFGTTEPDNNVYTFYVSDINVPGDFTIMIKNVGTTDVNRQAVIDDISWTGFSSTDPYLSITSPTDAQEVTSADVDIVFNAMNFELGTDGRVKYTVDGGSDLFTTTSPIELTGLVDGEHTVAMELVDMSDASLTPAVTDQVTFTVNTAAPTYTTIYDIQYTTDPSGNSPLMDQVETTRGVVSATNGDKFWIQDGAGAWNGVYVYYTTTPGPARGDSVWVTGTVIEFNNLTEISPVTNMTVINSGNTIAAAEVLATGSVGTEAYEGVLVNVTGVCTNDDYGFGMIELTDGSGTILVDDVLYDGGFVQGNSYTVTGITEYSYSEWKILPRDAADVIDNGASTTPLLTITSPANSATVYTANVSVAFNVSNFILGTDGKVAWNVDGGTDAYVTTSPISVLGLSDGSHTVNLELVDMSDNPLGTPVTATVTFTVDLSGPAYTSISDIQNGIATGDVWVKAVVSANFNGAEFGEGYYIQQGGGAWNGIYVYDTENVPAIGDSVEIAASIDEFFDMTQLEDVTSYSVFAIDGIVAAPTEVSTLDAGTEQYESVLVRVTNAVCDTVQNGYGEWWVNDGTGALMCKDNGVFDFTEVLGTAYNITGVMAYSYGEFSIQYRRDTDIQIANNIESEFANAVSIYPNPANSMVNIITDGAETITITNLVGQIVKEISVSNSTETISISDLNSGVYFVKLAKQNETATIKLVVE